MKRWIILGILGVAAVASARPPRVALTPIDGDISGDLGDAVAEALEGGDGELLVMAPTKVARAVDKLGYDDDLTVKQAKKLAAALEADAVIEGKLEKQGKRKVLHFTLFVHGKRARGFTVTYSNAKSEKFKTKLREKMISRIAPGAAAPEDEGEGEGDGDGEAEGAAAPIKHKKPTKKPAKASDDDEATDEEVAPSKHKRVASEDEGDDEVTTGVTAVGGGHHAANRVAVRADLGVSLENRSLTFTQRAGFTAGPKPYKNGPVPGARFEAEMYPMAFTKPDSFLAGVGFAVEYDKTLALNLRTTAEANTTVKANQMHYAIGLRVRVPFGKKPTSPSMTIGVGYAKRMFTFDRSTLMNPMALDLPQTEYAMVDPGLTFRIPLGATIALIAGGEGWLITDAGEIQRPTSYGKAKVFGGTGRAGLDVVLGNRFAIRVVGEFSQVGYTFTGTGALSNNRDGDPMTTDIGGAADRSVGGAATLAVLY